MYSLINVSTKMILCRFEKVLWAPATAISIHMLLRSSLTLCPRICTRVETDSGVDSVESRNCPQVGLPNRKPTKQPEGNSYKVSTFLWFFSTNIFLLSTQTFPTTFPNQETLDWLRRVFWQQSLSIPKAASRMCFQNLFLHFPTTFSTPYQHPTPLSCISFQDILAS